VGSEKVFLHILSGHSTLSTNLLLSHPRCHPFPVVNLQTYPISFLGVTHTATYMHHSLVRCCHQHNLPLESSRQRHLLSMSLVLLVRLLRKHPLRQDQ
jgi:hypothetical protein